MRINWMACVLLAAIAAPSRAEFEFLTTDITRTTIWYENGLSCDVRVIRLYASFSGEPGDGVFSVFGNADHPITVGGPGVFLNDDVEDALGPPANLTGGGYWSNQWDTYVTIGATDADDIDLILSPAFGAQTNDLATPFTSTSVAWAAMTPATPDEDGRVLLAQFVTDDGYCINGQLNLQLADGSQVTDLAIGPPCCPSYLCFGYVDAFGFDHYTIDGAAIATPGDTLDVSNDRGPCAYGVAPLVGDEPAYTVDLDFGEAGLLLPGQLMRLEAVTAPIELDFEDDDSRAIVLQGEPDGTTRVWIEDAGVLTEDVDVRLWHQGLVVQTTTFSTPLPSSLATGSIGTVADVPVRISASRTTLGGDDRIEFDLRITETPIAVTGERPVVADRISIGAAVDLPAGEDLLRRIELRAEGFDSFRMLDATTVPIGPDCAGDIDGDGETGISDLLFVLGAWGTTDPFADLGGDGLVDTCDMLIILAEWGPCAP